MRRLLRRAAVVGAVVESIIFAPLFLVSTFKISDIPLVRVSIPTLVIALVEHSLVGAVRRSVSRLYMGRPRSSRVVGGTGTGRDIRISRLCGHVHL